MKTNILNTLDFLAKKEKVCHKYQDSTFESHFEALKSLYIDSEKNDFFKNIITMSIYETMKPMRIEIEEMLSNKEALSFLLDYDSFVSSFEENYSDSLIPFIEEFKSVLNFDKVSNKNDLTSFIITESLKEYSMSEKRWLSKSIKKEQSDIAKISEHFLKSDNDADMLKILSDKPFGYYCFRVPYKKIIGSTFSYTDFIIVSNQAEGVIVYDLFSKILGRSGLQSNSYTLENIFTKNHKVEIKYNVETDNEVAQNFELTDIERLPVINRLILKTFVTIANNQENINELKNENKVIAYRSDSIGESILPVVKDFDNEKMPIVTLEELEFKGEYDFLSIFDKLFGDFYSIEDINLKRNKKNRFYKLSRTIEDNKLKEEDLLGISSLELNIRNSNLNRKQKEIKDFSKKSFNDCYYIEEINHEKSPVGIQKSKELMIPIIETMLGTKENVKKHILSVAKMNKLTLLSQYVDFYIELYSDTHDNELRDFFLKNLPELLEDEVFLKMVKTVGFSTNVKSIYYGMTDYGSSLLLDRTFSSYGEIEDSKLVKDYMGKNKAVNLWSIWGQSFEIMDYVLSNYENDFSEETTNIIEIDKAFCLLKRKQKEQMKNGAKVSTFFSFVENGTDIELNNWFGFYRFFNFSFFTTAKQTKILVEKINRLNDKQSDSIIQKISAALLGQSRLFEK